VGVPRFFFCKKIEKLLYLYRFVPYGISMQTTSHQFATIADAKAFALAGNAILTLQSQKTGAHFTYKVRQAHDRQTNKPVDSYYVSLLSGTDNENDYFYLGLIRDGRFIRTAKSRAGQDAPSFKAFSYFWNVEHNGNTQLLVRHEGRCGHCGRTLTHPASIDLGIGPECASKMGGAE
jgi:uncharacterized protein DUF6011